MVKTMDVCMGKLNNIKSMTASEFKELTKDGLVPVIVNISYFGDKLMAIAFKMADGRFLVFSEENNPSWEGSSEGWINVSICTEFPEWMKEYEEEGER